MLYLSKIARVLWPDTECFWHEHVRWRFMNQKPNQADRPSENISQLLNTFRPTVDDLSKLMWKVSDS
jgi:hypothetical protein